MDFNPSHNLITIEEESFFDWDCLQDPLADDPPLFSETDGLAPLPDSLERCEALSALVSHEYGRFEDVDLDSFTWDGDILPSSQHGVINEAVPLNIVADPNLLVGGNSAFTLANTGSSVGAIGGRDEERHMVMRRNERARSSEIGFDEMRRYFYMPIMKAAKEMNVGLTVLKKRCRELGIPRWPHRKMKSLRSLIYNVQELGMVKCEENIQRELETLEEHRRRMEEDPGIQLTEGTKKLRQFCFKANYKRRRGMQKPYFDPRTVHFIQ